MAYIRFLSYNSTGKRLCILIILFSAIYLGNCYAQPDNYKFSRIDINKGLSHNQVNCILKDSRGFMWFGTLSGLNRYDGYNFRIFRNNPKDTTSINDNYINRIFEDNTGKLWVGTREGFVIYNPEKETFDRNISGFLRNMGINAESAIELVNFDKDRSFIITADYKLYEYSVRTKNARIINNSEDTLKGIQKQVYSAIPDRDGNIWFISTTGVLELTSAENYEVLYRDYTIYRNFPKEYMDFRLFVDADNDLWVYAANSSQGLYHFNSRSRVFSHYNTASPDIKLGSNIVRGLEQDDEGIIWVGTDHGGINLINKKTPYVSYLLSNPYDDRSLSQNTITTLYRDNTGIIWAGTFKKGVSYYHEDVIKFRLIKHQASDPENITYDDVNCFSEDENGNLWIGTNGGGLVYYDRGKNLFRHFKHNPNNKNSLSSDVIVSMYMDQSEKLWIGTYFGGLNCFDGKRFVHYRHNPDNPNSLADDRVWDIYGDKDNNLWIATLGGGLDLLDVSTGRFRHFKYSVDSLLTSDFIASVKEDNKNNIWIGTAVGVNVYNKSTGQFRYYAASAGDTASLINDNINCIKIDSRQNIWIGTREGLSMFDPRLELFRNFTKENGLPDNSVFSVAEDLNGNLWLGTTNGLSNLVIEKDNSDNITYRFKNFDESDGLQGKEFNKGAAFRTKKGELLFGGTNGFNIFYPDDIRANKRKPDIVFTSLQIFNNEVKVGEKINGRVILKKTFSQVEKIVLKYHENVISIEFAALDYFQPEKNQYEYMLEGFNNTWMKTDASLRKATYTNLDQGDYVFRVRASNNDGVWNTEGVSLKITVLPPFWKTKTAFVIYFFAIIGLLLLLRHLILERERMRHRVHQERIDAHRRHEIDMLKIKFITNISHEFKTPLSLIITPLENLIKNSGSSENNKYLTLIYRNARRLLNLVNQLLDFRRLEFQELKLNLAQGDIISFVRDITDSFSDLAEKKEIDYRFHSSLKEIITFFDQDKVEKITFNLLSNAFKFTPEKGVIGVTVDIADTGTLQFSSNNDGFAKYICISVNDTGIGIPEEKQGRIFERFFSEDNQKVLINQGSGIGLSLVNEFVKSHKGYVKLESEPGKGSRFTIYLPFMPELPVEDKKIPDLSADETLPGSSPLYAAEMNEETEKPDTRRQVIMLVEDNADFLFYLKDNLKMNYSIIEASNGLEGWQLAQQKIPDLIVTDIMMPEMDGIELCKKIKSDKNTSHIPVILLTGRTSNKKRLEGFELGADDYITKPFSFEILESRIKNLILQRELIRKSFQKRFELTPSEIQITSLDEKLIKKALLIVENNISDPDFSVDKLSREIGMSRVHLYKKLTSLTGKTPIEFIRIIRLRRAAQLLEKSQLSVSEVAYQVGFNNPKYFTKYFKSEFKLLPSEYASSKQTKSGDIKSF
ncbi:MAG: response regulator [Bacteroidales bacterium]|nr:response regulator [Bacteroidales bacterium]